MIDTNTAEKPRFIEYPKKNGKHDWDTFFAKMEAGTSFDIPARHRAMVSSAASHRGYKVKSEIQGEVCRFNLIDATEYARRKMLFRIKRLPTKHLKAIYDAAKQSGIISELTKP